VQELLEEEWQEALTGGDHGEMLTMAEMGAFFLAGYCGSFQGFELLKILLMELKDQIRCEDSRHEVAHVGISLRGHFKARGNGKVKLLIMVAAVTASGLKPVLWLSHLVDMLADLGITSGWLFQNDKGYPQPLSFFEEGFYATLFAICDHDPSLVEPEMDILEDYQLACSLCCGATTRATEAGVSQLDIDWMNCWETDGKEIITAHMQVVYAEQKQLLSTYLQFSLAL